MEGIVFKVPFGYLPAHWGLAGKTREIAKAEYELSGYELAEKLLCLEYEDDDTNKEFQKKILDLRLKHKKITELAYYRNLAELIDDPKQKELALLELDYKEGKVKEVEYQKKSATLKGEPWVIVLSMDFDHKNSLEGSFELDWNDLFVEQLKAEGYKGVSPDKIVNQWFMEVCRNVAMEEFDGVGDFTPDSEANLEAVRRWSSETLPKGKKGYR
jgi:hypothetical protein